MESARPILKMFRKNLVYLSGAFRVYSDLKQGGALVSVYFTFAVSVAVGTSRDFRKEIEWGTEHSAVVGQN